MVKGKRHVQVDMRFVLISPTTLSFIITSDLVSKYIPTN